MAGVDERAGERILHAVERIVAKDERILEQVQCWRWEHGDDREALARAAIAHYSNLSGLTGGATAIPAAIPGVGLLIGLVGAPLADMVLVLKLEIELGLCLATIHGYDVRRPDVRQLVFLASAIHAASARGLKPAPLEALEVGTTAIWSYAPRRVSKMLVTVLAQLAILFSSRGLWRAIPIAGVVVGAAMNKLLTERTGRRLHQDLALRRRLERGAAS